jgi:hypothetical protein
MSELDLEKLRQAFNRAEFASKAVLTQFDEVNAELSRLSEAGELSDERLQEINSRFRELLDRFAEIGRQLYAGSDSPHLSLVKN